MRNPGHATVALLASGLLACGGSGSGPTASSSPAPVVSGGPFDLLFTGLARPHAEQGLYVVVIKDDDGRRVERGHEVIAADGSFSFSWSGILEGSESYHLDFFADHNGNGRCDPPPTDHTWQESLGTVTGTVSHHFNHHANFVDVCASWS
jgi:hypothetical protein